MLGQLGPRFLGFFIFLVLSGPSLIIFILSSNRCYLSGRLVLLTESWQSFVVGGGGDSCNGDVDLSSRVEDPVSSFENAFVSVFCKLHVTCVGTNVDW